MAICSGASSVLPWVAQMLLLICTDSTVLLETVAPMGVEVMPFLIPSLSSSASKMLGIPSLSRSAPLSLVVMPAISSLPALPAPLGTPLVASESCPMQNEAEVVVYFQCKMRLK